MYLGIERLKILNNGRAKNKLQCLSRPSGIPSRSRLLMFNGILENLPFGPLLNFLLLTVKKYRPIKLAVFQGRHPFHY